MFEREIRAFKARVQREIDACRDKNLNTNQIFARAEVLRACANELRNEINGSDLAQSEKKTLTDEVNAVINNMEQAGDARDERNEIDNETAPGVPEDRDKTL